MIPRGLKGSELSVSLSPSYVVVSQFGFKIVSELQTARALVIFQSSLQRLRTTCRDLTVRRGNSALCTSDSAPFTVQWLELAVTGGVTVILGGVTVILSDQQRHSAYQLSMKHTWSH